MCPILFEESPEDQLICGHILPQALRSASRATVLQRADVDHFFGTKIERTLIEFLNSVTYTKGDFLDRAKDLKIVGANGEPLDLFVPSPRSNPPFPRIGLRDGKGETIASPHVKGTFDDLGRVSASAEVQAKLSFHKASIDGAMLKAGHLALFRLMGYRWALSAAGRHAGDSLRQFFRSNGEQSDAESLFAGFDTAFHLILAVNFPFDTLTDATVVLHDDVNDARSVDPFAISCVFTVNDRKVLVTLPFSIDDDDFPSRLSDYRALTSDWHGPHRMVQTKITPTGLEPESIIRMKYTEQPPPGMIPPNRSDED